MTTQPGTDSQPKWPLNTDIPSLAGKVALVTGANSPGGMGFHTAYQLASAHAKVYIGARSIAKAEHAMAEMRSANPGIGPDNLVPFVADLGDLRAVQTAARQLAGSEERLDLLIHNAAVISMPVVLNEHGISVAFATNHLGPFVLTKELFSLLEKTAGMMRDIRVVVVAASSYKFLPPGIQFSSVESFNAEMEPTKFGGADFSRYSLSKLANILFSRQLQKKFHAAGIDVTSIAIHPGLIKTDGVISSLSLGKQRSLNGRLSPEEGAVTALFAATSPVVFEEKTNFQGAFLVPGAVVDELTGDAKNDELARELWETSEKVVAGILGGNS